MRAAQLRKRPRHFRNFTGLSVEQFERLAEGVKAELTQAGQEVGSRQRAVGGGRKATLALEDQLVVTLMYYRLYVTQLLLGGSGSISNVKLRDGYPRDRLLSLWQREYRQEWGSAKRQAEIPV